MRSRQEVAALNRERNLPINADDKRRIPLSEREKRRATGELTPGSTSLSSDLQNSYETRAKEQVDWTPGSHLWKMSTKDHPYLKAAADLNMPSIAAISGTTDRTMTMCMLLGLSQREELETARLTCMGWLLDGENHTINEVMTSSKGFGFEYTPSPTSYKQIYPQDSNFEIELSNAQQARGFNLPDIYLSAEYALKKAKQLKFVD